MKNSSKYFIYNTTGKVSSTLEQELILLICKELAFESSHPVVGSVEVLPACRGSAEGRGFAGLQGWGHGDRGLTHHRHAGEEASCCPVGSL